MAEAINIDLDRLKKLEALEDRLKVLEKLEGRLKTLEALEAKVKARNKTSLDKLLEKKANSPVPIYVEAPSTARVLRHIAKDRDAYNAKQRERRRLKKEQAEALAIFAELNEESQAIPPALG